MNDIANTLSAHEWTIYSFVFGVLCLFIIPFRKESALKSVLTSFKENKDHESALIEKLQDIVNKQTEQITDLYKHIAALHNENAVLRKELANK